MKDGHRIEITEDYDKTRECFHAYVTLTEFRQGKQYGGAVVWEHSGPTSAARSHDQFMSGLVQLIKTEVLSLLTFKIK